LTYQLPIDEGKQIKDHLNAIEKDVKDYLVQKFEDERIKQVKKITNWDLNIDKFLD
jgi:hypothetical protein